MYRNKNEMNRVVRWRHYVRCINRLYTKRSEAVIFGGEEGRGGLKDISFESVWNQVFFLLLLVSRLYLTSLENYLINDVCNWPLLILRPFSSLNVERLSCLVAPGWIRTQDSSLRRSWIITNIISTFFFTFSHCPILSRCFFNPFNLETGQENFQPHFSFLRSTEYIYI